MPLLPAVLTVPRTSTAGKSALAHKKTGPGRGGREEEKRYLTAVLLNYLHFIGQQKMCNLFLQKNTPDAVLPQDFMEPPDKPLRQEKFVKHTSSFDLSMLGKYNIDRYEKNAIDSNEKKPKG